MMAEHFLYCQRVSLVVYRGVLWKARLSGRFGDLPEPLLDVTGLTVNQRIFARTHHRPYRILWYSHRCESTFSSWCSNEDLPKLVVTRYRSSYSGNYTSPDGLSSVHTNPVAHAYL